MTAAALTWAKINIYFPPFSSMDNIMRGREDWKTSTADQKEFIYMGYLLRIEAKLLTNEKYRMLERSQFTLTLGDWKISVDRLARSTPEVMDTRRWSEDFYAAYFDSYVRACNIVYAMRAKREKKIVQVEEIVDTANAKRATEIAISFTEQNKRNAEQAELEGEWEVSVGPNGERVYTKKQKTECYGLLATYSLEKGRCLTIEEERQQSFQPEDLKPPNCPGITMKWIVNGEHQYWDFTQEQILNLPSHARLQKYECALKYTPHTQWPPAVSRLTYEIYVQPKIDSWYSRLKDCAQADDVEARGILFLLKELAPDPGDKANLNSLTYYKDRLPQALAQVRNAQSFSASEIGEDSAVKIALATINNLNTTVYGYTPLGLITQALADFFNGQFWNCSLGADKTWWNCAFNNSQKAHILTIRLSILKSLDPTNVFTIVGFKCSVKPYVLPDWLLYAAFGFIIVVGVGAGGYAVHEVRQAIQ